MKNYSLSNLNSFLLALAIYISIVILVFFRLVSEVEPAIQYTDIKDSFVDIELAEPSKQVITQSNTPKEIQKPTEQIDIEKLFAQTTNKTVKTEDIDQKASNFNELFGNIKEIQEEKTTKIQSSAKSGASSAAKPQASELVKQLNDSLLQEESSTQGESTKAQKIGIYDEFFRESCAYYHSKMDSVLSK